MIENYGRLLTLLTLLFGMSVYPGSASAQVPVLDKEVYPYAPSLLRYDKSGANFTEPSTCGGCHPTQYEEWQGSMHALAFQDPIYQGELNLAFKAVGHEVTKQCEGCHSPAAVVTGEIKGPGLEGLSPMALAGVSCDVCHSVKAVTHWETPSHEPENGSMVLAPGRDTESGSELVKRGPLDPGKGCGGGFHTCEKSSLHEQAELCASCHQVYHYQTHFPIEASYQEWKHSPYAQAGIACHDCHMVELETFERSADLLQKPEKGDYHHYFNGANYLVYSLARAAALKAGDEALAAILTKKHQMAIERLKAAAELELSSIYQNGVLSELKVRVKNARAGHNLPTSLTNIRQMWLEVTAKNKKGEVILSSGHLKEDGSLPENTRNFNSDGMRSDGHATVDPWVLTAFSRHDTIPPKGYRDVYYGIPVDKGSGPISIEVKLKYRQGDQKIANKLLKSVPEDIDLEKIYGLSEVPPLPVIEMVAKTATFQPKK